MMRSLLLIGFGVVLGSTASLYWTGSLARDGGVDATDSLGALRNCQSKVAEQERVVLSLTQSVAQSTTECAVPTAIIESAHERDNINDQETSSNDQAITWRVSAVEKFIPLSEEQKDRLKEKYREDQEAKNEGRESEAESLSDIVGEENASLYRQQVQDAFQRVQNEELEKEIVWASRKLNLSEVQEQSMQSAFFAIERALRAEFAPMMNSVSDPAQRVMVMIQENKKRRDLRAESAKAILTPDQLKDFLALEAQSSSADMEVFHDPGDHG